MVLMTTEPRGRLLTVEDLDLMPDDGQRYELIDGVLVVSPSPVPAHQVVVVELLYRLRSLCPDELSVLTAPMDVLAEDTAVEPDILVTRRSALGARYVEGPPLLVAEVLSPSTRMYDLNTKFSRYQRAGVESYWVVDPHELTMIVWDLRGQTYVEVANLGPDDTWSATQPFEVSFRPGDLLR